MTVLQEQSSKTKQSALLTGQQHILRLKSGISAACTDHSPNSTCPIIHQHSPVLPTCAPMLQNVRSTSVELPHPSPRTWLLQCQELTAKQIPICTTLPPLLLGTNQFHVLCVHLAQERSADQFEGSQDRPPMGNALWLGRTGSRVAWSVSSCWFTELQWCMALVGLTEVKTPSLQGSEKRWPLHFPRDDQGDTYAWMDILTYYTKTWYFPRGLCGWVGNRGISPARTAKWQFGGDQMFSSEAGDHKNVRDIHGSAVLELACVCGMNLVWRPQTAGCLGYRHV